MGYYSEHPAELRKARLNHIDHRWGQLHALETEWGEKAIKYLLLTNSGGAIATLSFLGASKAALGSTGAKLALFLFIFGVFLVGVMTAKQFHFSSNLFKSYKCDVEEYFSDSLQWQQLAGQDEERSKEDLFDYIIPYSSFGEYGDVVALGEWRIWGRCCFSALVWLN